MKIIEKTYRWNGTLARRGVTRRIILHHAAAVTCSTDQIHAWHLANGWSGIGYHFFVRKDGTVSSGLPRYTVGAHAGGSNSDSIGVCFEGSFDKEEMPAVQRRAGTELVAYLKKKYGVTTVQRHSDVNATGCPGTHFPFDAIAYGREAEPSAPSVPAAAASDRKSGAASLLPVLRRGSAGGHVRAVQALLNGYGCDSGAVDGIFGGGTAGAVKRFQRAAGLAQRVHALDGQKALTDQVAVEHGRSVPLAEHKAVAIRVVGVRGVDVHPLLIQQREDLTGRQAAARVTGLCAVNGREYVDPILTAELLELSRAFRCQRHGNCPPVLCYIIKIQRPYFDVNGTNWFFRAFSLVNLIIVAFARNNGYN